MTFFANESLKSLADCFRHSNNAETTEEQINEEIQVGDGISVNCTATIAVLGSG